MTFYFLLTGDGLSIVHNDAKSYKKHQLQNQQVMATLIIYTPTQNVFLSQFFGEDLYKAIFKQISI